jgi:hypothetical protein
MTPEKNLEVFLKKEMGALETIVENKRNELRSPGIACSSYCV